ncbi:hypothetical protein [Methylobacterium iners]|uniref:Uncharacterized protein n=1 Tax=Methylobacterium iners TaxID=418707 RepID=A0ABQ4RRN6_9HYPH|nr:hypothetical protein [Methylobacterium iners]GJD92869.1 hypothetical protein OCOJLMKI_0052 [Methylobacterium iners]
MSDQDRRTSAIPADLGDCRNVYRRADGSLRYGCMWRTREAAEAMREVLPGETFVELQDCRTSVPEDAGG